MRNVHGRTGLPSAILQRFNQSAPECSLYLLLQTTLSVGDAVFLSVSENKSLLQRFTLLMFSLLNHSTLFWFWQVFFLFFLFFYISAWRFRFTIANMSDHIPFRIFFSAIFRSSFCLYSHNLSFLCCFRLIRFVSSLYLTISWTVCDKNIKYWA